MKKEGMLAFALLAVFIIVLSSYLVYANPYQHTELQSPNWCTGQWVNCTNAFSYDGQFSTAVRVRHVGSWIQFNFSLSDDSPIQKVELIEALPASKKAYIEARVSDDAGLTFGPPHIVGGNTNPRVFYTDITDDAVWTARGLNIYNLTVNLTCLTKIFQHVPPWVENIFSHIFKVRCNIDWLAVNVTYIDKFNFTIKVDPTQGVIRINSQNETSTNVSAILLSGSNRLVDLQYEGCPMDVLCGFSQNPIMTGTTSVFKVKAKPTAPLGRYDINITGTAMGMARKAVFNITIILG